MAIFLLSIREGSPLSQFQALELGRSFKPRDPCWSAVSPSKVEGLLCNGVRWFLAEIQRERVLDITRGCHSQLNEVS